jgi:multiple sugar transport system ATP-binding protein
MSSVTLEAIQKRFGSFTAVKEMNLAVRNGEFVAILGPSGCGKTTTMNIVAGIEKPSAGRVRFDANDVTEMPIQKRGVGFVFQNYAIFTHMTVRQNLAFGLEVQGVPAAECKKRIDAMAEFMALTHRLDEKSSSLSVNELQKLAIGRSAIVEPRIFLLDEPLSNLDAAFRERMRAELRQLQRSLKQTMIYVTHDQIEAMGLADRIAVMSQGELQQFGTPADIYAKPRNMFVARFIGAPSMNVIRSKVATGGNGTSLHLGGAGGDAVTLPPALASLAKSAGLEVNLGFRPETLTLADEAGPGTISAEIALIETVGRRRIVHFETGDAQFLGVFERALGLKAGDRAHIALNMDLCHLFHVETEARLAAQGETA